MSGVVRAPVANAAMTPCASMRGSLALLDLHASDRPQGGGALRPSAHGAEAVGRIGEVHTRGTTGRCAPRLEAFCNSPGSRAT